MQVISDASQFNEDISLEKKALCFSIKASNSFYIEFYDLLRIENFLKRTSTYNNFISNVNPYINEYGENIGKSCN